MPLEDERLKLLMDKMDAVINTVQAITKKNAPQRLITKEISAQLVDNLRNCKPLRVKIESIMNDTEAYNLSKQLADIFVAAGWSVDMQPQVIFSYPFKGIFLEMGTEPSQEFQRAMLPLFSHFNLKKEIYINKDLAIDNLLIKIGSA